MVVKFGILYAYYTTKSYQHFKYKKLQINNIYVQGGPYSLPYWFMCLITGDRASIMGHPAIKVCCYNEGYLEHSLCGKP